VVAQKEIRKVGFFQDILTVFSSSWRGSGGISCA